MAEYKIIFKADTDTEGAGVLTWEPGCPALVTAVQASRNTETSATYLQVKIRNVSGAAVSSIFAELEAGLPDGSVDRVPLEYLDADIPAGAEKALKAVKLPHSDLSSCAIKISRATLASGQWKTSTAAQPVPKRQPLPHLPQRAYEQRARALSVEAEFEVLHGAVQDHGDWWVCACGQVNVGRDACCACKQSKALLLANEDEAKLLADADAFDERTYNEAVKLQDEGTLKALKQAAVKFKTMGNHKDAPERLKQCRIAMSDKRRKLSIITAIAVVLGVAAAVALAICATGFSYDKDFFVNSKWEVGDEQYQCIIQLNENGEIDLIDASDPEIQERLDSFQFFLGRQLSLGTWKYEMNTLTLDITNSIFCRGSRPTYSSTQLPFKFSNTLEIPLQASDGDGSIVIKKAD